MITGERVVLRPIDEHDTEAVLRWRARPDVVAQLFSERAPTRDEHLAWLARLRERDDREEFVIVERATGRSIGTIGLSAIDRRDGRGEYGILIGEPDARGRGLAAEASRLLLEHAFDVLGLHRVYLHVLADNVRALVLYEALGFQREGLLRDHARKDGRFRDVVVMGLLSHARSRLVVPVSEPGSSPNRR